MSSGLPIVRIVVATRVVVVACSAVRVGLMVRRYIGAVFFGVALRTMATGIASRPGPFRGAARRARSRTTAASAAASAALREDWATAEEHQKRAKEARHRPALHFCLPWFSPGFLPPTPH